MNLLTRLNHALLSVLKGVVIKSNSGKIKM